MTIKEKYGTVKPSDFITFDINIEDVELIETKDVIFQHKALDEEIEGFTLGPVDFEAGRGEIVFITGGNGSGKTTLAKLLTGLYAPSGGRIVINGEDIANFWLGEYCSAVFDDYHLCRKPNTFGPGHGEKLNKAKKFLKKMRLEKKVEISGNTMNTGELSGVLRRRLALLLCYLENSPVCLFDEVAAGQEHRFRDFFYRELLPDLREQNKIVIVITQDDHYFDVADKIVKLDMGKVDVIKENVSTLSISV